MLLLKQLNYLNAYGEIKFTMISFWQLLIHFAMIYNYSNAVNFTSTAFRKYPIDGVRLSHQYRTEESASLISCCSLCHDDASCKYVSYQLSTGLCEMNNNYTFVGFELVNEDGWTTYKRK